MSNVKEFTIEFPDEIYGKRYLTVFAESEEEALWLAAHPGKTSEDYISSEIIKLKKQQHEKSKSKSHPKG